MTRPQRSTASGSPTRRRGAARRCCSCMGLGYGRWGWEPVVEPLAERLPRDLVRQPRASARATCRPGRTRRRRWPATRVAVLDAAGFERAHVVGTSLGGMVAQELALDQPERVDRLVARAARRPAGRTRSRCRSGRSRLFARVADAPAGGGAAAASSRTRCPTAGARPPSSSRSSSRYRLAHPPTMPAGRRRPPPGMTFDSADRLGAIARADARAARRPRTTSSTPATRSCSPMRIPDARVELFDGRRPPLLLGASPSGSSARCASSSRDRLHTIDRWLRDRARLDAGPRRDRRPGAATLTYGELEARSDRLAATLARARPERGDRVATLTGNSAEHVAAFFACAKAGADPAAALTGGCRRVELALPARRRRAGAAARRGRVRRARDGALAEARHAPARGRLGELGDGGAPVPGDVGRRRRTRCS